MPYTNPTFTEEELQNEIWKPIPNIEQWYEVSNLGRIRRFKSAMGTHQGRILKVQQSADGYLTISGSADRHHINMTVHRVVASAFLGPRPQGYEINHKDGNKTNNRPSNLEYVTHLENLRHAIEVLKVQQHHPQGVENKNSKLTPDKISLIRRLRKQGYTQQQIATVIGVAQTTVGRVLLRRTWRHATSS
jgi:hypothetical protein